MLATAGGRIMHGPLTGLTAASVNPVDPAGFSDLAMAPGGSTGVAVGPSGQIYRSADAGATWAPVTGTTEYSDQSCLGGATPTSGALSDDLLTVKFADASTVYITGRHADVLKSTDGGASFTEVNKRADATCVADPSEDWTGQQWIDANHGYLISSSFGASFTTLNGFATVNSQGESVNHGRARVAINPAAPSHAWAISDGPHDSSYFKYTTDNGVSWTSPTFDDNEVSFQDVAFSGGTVLAVGQGGDIYTSADGKTFQRQIAAAPLNTNDWHSIAMLDATHAVVGGANGALVMSSNANGVVPPAPQPATSGTSATSNGKTVAVTVSCPSACTATITITLSGGAARDVARAAKTVVIAKGAATLGAHGHKQVRLALAKAGKRLLKSHHGKLNGRIVLNTKTLSHKFTTSHALKIRSTSKR